ncbi:MAG: hypothetical protein NTZ42_01000 [Candidatus Gribaldobacteria bacterium]|nr:hypothetical protein [Candidatus Gribaldobacteria bacterium]
MIGGEFSENSQSETRPHSSPAPPAGGKRAEAGRILSHLIDLGFQHGLLDGKMQTLSHELRKVRDSVHISNLEDKEYNAYNREQVNQYIMLLNNFQNRIKEKYSKMIG